MTTYNSAFFGLFENLFRLLKFEFGEQKALNLFCKLMETGLTKSYGQAFEKGKLSEFERLVGERDKMVGLRVAFVKLSDTELIYQFHEDPFPNLKGFVDPHQLDHCYLAFKINYILGSEWSYRTNKHLWKGDLYTEHYIYKQ
ncbi:MAG: hypothetical protein H0U75_03850 [Legionella sp.]|nr:hypothetical protein [Legionella sp.]